MLVDITSWEKDREARGRGREEAGVCICVFVGFRLKYSFDLPLVQESPAPE